LCIGVDAEGDARMFAALASERGFLAPVLLLAAAATRAAVRAKLEEMAALTAPGDLVLLTFSGHGGRTRVRANGELQDVGTWQLYDGRLNGEQLRADLARFRRGVRVLLVCDCCGGGIPAPHYGGLDASVLVLAACKQGMYADGAGLPAHFARAFASTERCFDGSHSAFHEALCNSMPPYQKSDYYPLGVRDAVFEAQRPLAI
jgi:hypothetical protein